MLRGCAIPHARHDAGGVSAKEERFDMCRYVICVTSAVHVRIWAMDRSVRICIDIDIICLASG